MTTLREWVIRLWGTLRPSRRDAELEEELRGHLEMAVEHARRRADSTADSTEDARRAAAIRSGGMAQTIEALRDQRGLPWLDSVRRDLCYAWGAIARNPGFTLVATATLGAGLTLSLTVVTVVNAYLIRPLPYPAADRLYSVGLATGGPGQPRGLADIDWTALDGVVEHRIAWDLDMYYLLGGSYPESAPGAWVTPGFLQALGLRAERGRALEAADFRPEGSTAVMISHRLWVGRFGSDPDIVGRTLKAYVSDRPDEPETLTVVGVLADFWHLNIYTDILGPLRAPSYPYLVTLRDGVDPGSAADRVTALVRNSRKGLPEGWRATLVPLQVRYVEEMRPLLKAVAMSAALVLVIACANVAVLLLARSARRRHEIAIRLALGASRGRLARLLAFEALLLGGMATALGLGASAVLTRGLAPLVEQRLGRRLPGGESALALDGTLLLVALAGGVLVTLVLTLAPLLTLWSTTVTPALKSGGRGITEGRGTRRLRSALIACEIAAALALLVGSALMIQSSLQLLGTDPGFRASGVLTTSVGLRARSYPDAVNRADFYTHLLRRLDERTRGGLVALSDAWPLQQSRSARVESTDEYATVTEAGVVRVSAGYFATLGIPLRDGASFAEQDRAGGEPVAVVSESLAHRLWPVTRAVGQRLRISNSGGRESNAAGPLHLVVGVVGDVRQVDYDDGQVQADAHQLDVYLPLLQDAGRFAFVYTRDFSDAPAVLRLTVSNLDREASVGPPESLASALVEARNGPRQVAWVLSVFAGFAALLALLGVYSVIAYGVRQREREIGVRLMVGADSRAVTRLFVKEGSPLVACGLAVGIMGAAALGEALRSQLFGVEPMEPSVLAATTTLFAICSWVALWWPARRAALVDPASLLRDE
jgi:putative ABC transport system permease protein